MKPHSTGKVRIPTAQGRIRRFDLSALVLTGRHIVSRTYLRLRLGQAGSIEEAWVHTRFDIVS